MWRKFFQLFSLYKYKIFGCAILLLCAWNFLVWASVFKNLNKSDIEIYFFDVGQGDASLIEAKDGTQILIDGGPPNKILPKLSSALDFGDKSLDVLILTHPHADHVSGAIEILQNYEVGTIIESGVGYNTSEAKEFEKLVAEKKLKKLIVDKPLTLNFFNGARLRFLYPDRSFANAILKNVHDATVVSELLYNGQKILFMGDAEKNIENYLASKNLVDDVDVLKVGHHGSKTSTTHYFLSRIKPEYAVIQVGKNRYGHPTQEVLSRLESFGAQIFRTDTDGTIKFEINNLGNLKFSQDNVR